MSRPLPRLLTALALIVIAGYAFIRALNVGGRMSIGFEVGATAPYPAAIWAQSNATLLLAVAGAVTIVAAGLLLAWLIRGKALWMPVVAGLLLIAGVAGLGWGFPQAISGTRHLDSITFQDTPYHLSVWHGGAPGGWQVWRCPAGAGDCTVIRAIDARADVVGLTRPAAAYPARLEIDGDALYVVIAENGSEARIEVAADSGE